MKELLSRKAFLTRSLVGAFSLVGLTWGGKKVVSAFSEAKKINGKIQGANHAIGHLLRGLSNHDKEVEKKSDTLIQTKVLIVGAGIAGLSAARTLYKSGEKDLLILDLEDHSGGNASSGQNTVSAYPWAAHYLPIANNDNQLLLDFLEEHQLITGYNSDGLPIYNDYYLCHSPQERLFLKGRWQEGLIPNYGITAGDKKQIANFLALMEQYRQQKGEDGRWLFTIPLANASTDEKINELDAISMADFLEIHHFDSEYLRWYVDYCCRDDYGLTLEHTSAYAGIHYFAARKGKAANAEPNAVLTWAEGNAFLAKVLMTEFEDKIKTQHLVTQLEIAEHNVRVLAYNWKEKKTVEIHAERVILAIPQFVANRLLTPRYQLEEVSQFQYAPWMVANITVNRPPIENDGFLCWDNVAYTSKSLGYINTGHQSVERYKDKWVLTYYLPLSELSPVEERKRAIQKSHEQWVEEIIADLSGFHPAIRESIEEVDVKVWGHGMISPRVGFLTSDARKEANRVLEDKVFFAHTDLSGISIFEEAFHQGNKAARELLNTLV